ncbi:hypothetical protein Plhal304r1_c103g0175411 [Plasmopara halstedii]
MRSKENMTLFNFNSKQDEHKDIDPLEAEEREKANNIIDNNAIDLIKLSEQC